MAASKAPLVKAAILNILAQNTALASVQRTWGHPGDSLAMENIHVGEARSRSDWGALGNRKRYEDPLTVEIVVIVGSTGPDTQQTAEERMWDLADEIETALRDDPSIGGTVDFITDIDIEQNNVMGDKAWASVASISVSCHTTN